MLLREAFPIFVPVRIGLIYNLAKSLLRNRENRLGAGSRDSTQKVILHMLSRNCINRITLLMQYFIERLGNLSTSFSARGCTCTWCGCDMFRFVGEAVSLLTKAAPGFNGRVTLCIESSLPCIFIKVT